MSTDRAPAPAPDHGGLLAARALADAGVEVVFAVPGGHVLHLLDGCREVGIRVVDTRHEGAAALAAEGYALATGRPGVAVVTAGPGFANSLIGLLDAGVWCVPLVLIGGRTGRDKEGRGAVMDVDQAAVAAPVAKHTVRCTHPGRIPHAVGEALHHARAGAPGPVYLEIPMDVYAAEVDPSTVENGGFPSEPPRPAGAPSAIEEARALIDGAERPVLLAGTGAHFSRAGAALADAAEALGVPVVTASAARGVLSDDHPWCLGSIVHAGGALLLANVVVVLGSAFNANLAFGRSPLFSDAQQVIQVDLRPEAIGGNRRPEVAIAGNVTEVLQALALDAGGPTDDRVSWRDQAVEIAGHLRATWDEQIAGYDGPGVHTGAAARTLMDVARQHAGDDLTVVVDGGDALAWGIAYAPASGPGRLLTTTTALGSLGVGVPFALAAKAARPDDLVVLLTGDGSFGLAAMELDTAVRHDLPIVCVVSNNAGWGDVSHEQDAWFGPGRHVASELRATRYDQLATALGAHGEHVEDLADLEPALTRAIESGRPAVVNVTTDPDILSDLLRNLTDLDVM